MRKALWGSLVSVVVLGAACGGTKSVEEPKGAAMKGNPPVAVESLPGAGHCARKNPGVGPERAAGVREGSAVALVHAGSKSIAYVADEDGHAIHTMDVAEGKLRASTPLSGAPSELLVMADGRVAVALRDKNRIQILEPTADADVPLESLCSVKTFVEPVGLAATPNDKTLVVTTAWGKKLTAYDADSLKRRYSADLPREPRDVLVDDDGSRAFVSHVVGGLVSVVDLKTKKHEVRDIDLRERKATGAMASGDLRQSCQGFALAKSIQLEDDHPELVVDEKPIVKAAPPEPDPAPTPKGPKPLQRPLFKAPVPASRIFAPRVTIDPGDPTRSSSGYGNSFGRIESPIVSVIDSGAERNLTTALLETTAVRGPFSKGECLLPRAAAVSAKSGGLFVACAGTDALIEMDARGNDPARLERRRWSLPAGPTGVAVDDATDTAVVWSQFDRQLAIVNLGSTTTATAVDVVTAPRLAKAELSADAAWGRKLFHTTDDQRISSDGRACASCHPDGREDALTWSTPVGPRQTIMLAGRLKASAPFSWLGAHESIEVHLRQTFQRLGGSGLPEGTSRVDELDALVAYLHVMPGPQVAGALVDDADAELVADGKKLFFETETGCAGCHSGGAGTDATKHNLGTRASADSDDKFDTPSLHFVGGTAPYFHDGRFTTLMDVLTSTDSQMGHSMQLSRNEARALAAYLGTL